MAIEVFCEKRINNAAVQHDVDTEQRRQFFLLVGLAGLCMVGLLFYGWQQYQWTQSGYEIESAQKKREELVEFRKQLIVEHTSYSRPERIDKIARDTLGMTSALPGQTEILTADSPGTIPESPAPEAPALTASKR